MDYADRLKLCHASCRRSKNTSPLAGCKCRCGGYAHASETLADMAPAERKRANESARLDLKDAAAWTEARALLAMVQRAARRAGAKR